MVIAPGNELLEHLHRSNVLDVYDAWSAERECRCIVKALRPTALDDLGARRRVRPLSGRELAFLALQLAAAVG